MVISLCRSSDDRSCDALLDAPESVFDDPDRWPSHLCEAVARESTRRWAQARTELMYPGEPLSETNLEWIDEWPLPVFQGSACIPPPLLPLDLPFASVGRAELILEPAIPFAPLTAFGIIDLRFSDRESMQFVSRGWDNKRASSFRLRAAKWWDGENATGRPAGRKFTWQKALDTFHAYEKEMGRPPNQLELATALSCTDKTLRNTIGSWPRFRAEAMADMLRRQRFPSREELERRRKRK